MRSIRSDLAEHRPRSDEQVRYDRWRRTVVTFLVICIAAFAVVFAVLAYHWAVFKGSHAKVDADTAYSWGLAMGAIPTGGLVLFALGIFYALKSPSRRRDRQQQAASTA